MAQTSDPTLSSVFLVRSEHLNHHGHLFGGDLMAEIDTIAYCLLREIYGEKMFVTRAAEISFENPARMGDAIHFVARVLKKGRTSIQVEVTGSVGDTQIGCARMIYVCIGEDGGKRAI